MTESFMTKDFFALQGNKFHAETMTGNSAHPPVTVPS